MTRYEQLIYAIVSTSTDHLTADQVFEELKKSCPTVSLATVYNNLKKLHHAGLIHKVSVEGSLDRYDRAVKHDHLVCQTCGAISDIRFDDLTEGLAAQLGDSVLSYDLKVFYTCPACKNAQRDSETPLS